MPGRCRRRRSGGTWHNHCTPSHLRRRPRRRPPGTAWIRSTHARGGDGGHMAIMTATTKRQIALLALLAFTAMPGRLPERAFRRDTGATRHDRGRRPQPDRGSPAGRPGERTNAAHRTARDRRDVQRGDADRRHRVARRADLRELPALGRRRPVHGRRAEGRQPRRLPERRDQPVRSEPRRRAPRLGAERRRGPGEPPVDPRHRQPPPRPGRPRRAEAGRRGPQDQPGLQDDQFPQRRRPPDDLPERRPLRPPQGPRRHRLHHRLRRRGPQRHRRRGPRLRPQLAPADRAPVRQGDAAVRPAIEGDPSSCSR